MTDNKRKELLPKAKPILFNTEMVKAILDGRKTVTRRVLKNQPCEECNSKGSDHDFIKDSDIIEGDTFTGFVCLKCGCGVSPPHGKYPVGTSYIRPPYKEGDILYVRETWSPVSVKPKRYLYKTHCPEADNLPVKWHPSIHMPKEAARIFLRVTNVRVERLQDITHSEIAKEGIVTKGSLGSPERINPYFAFKNLWDSTIKKSDLDKYGWNANPWVWVIEFERVD